ncbi:MAG: DUF1489 family protein [Polymorphobacter sp.]|uniref:DUF1489 family protein n=1 Tax=Polymorphobacter sp. TaxID=1909290 RepID=UPI003A844DF2
MLHLTKVAVGCPDLETLARLQTERFGPAAAAALTRFMPKQATDLAGGSLYWIIKHRIIARQPILGLAMVETPWGTKCRIDLAPGPIPVQPLPKRAHQGWRYLTPANAPPDLTPGDTDTLPTNMVRELQSLWLI